LGKNGKAKAGKDGWIILAERGDWNGISYPIVDIKSFKVDGVNILADTWYTLHDGTLQRL